MAIVGHVSPRCCRTLSVTMESTALALTTPTNPAWKFAKFSGMSPWHLFPAFRRMMSTIRFARQRRVISGTTMFQQKIEHTKMGLMAFAPSTPTFKGDGDIRLVLYAMWCGTAMFQGSGERMMNDLTDSWRWFSRCLLHQRENTLHGGESILPSFKFSACVDFDGRVRGIWPLSSTGKVFVPNVVIRRCTSDPVHATFRVPPYWLALHPCNSKFWKRVRLSRSLDTSTKTHMGEMSSVEDPVVLLEWSWTVILSRRNKSGWTENIDPMMWTILMKDVLGEPTSILTMFIWVALKEYQTCCGQLQEHVRVQGLCWDDRKNVFFSETRSKHFHMIPWHLNAWKEIAKWRPKRLISHTKTQLHVLTTINSKKEK